MRYLISVNSIPHNIILSDSQAIADHCAGLVGGVARLLADGETVEFPAAPVLPNYVLTRFEFLKRIGRANRKEIRTSADVNTIDGWDLVKSADLIDVRDDAVIEVVDAWRTAGIINMARRNAILAPN